MAEVLVHPELEVSFAYSESFGAYVATTTGGFFTLEAGQKYVVYWDDERCERTSFDFIFSDGSECVGIGNPLAAGQASNDDKFCIVYDKTHEINHFLSLEQSDSHTVSIYKIAEDEDDDEPTEPEQPEGIVLKDRNGEDVAYYGIETVTFDTTTDGKQQVYTKGVAVDGLEIMPDFSGGDMDVAAGIGELIRSAIIKDPTEEVIVDLNMANGDQIIVPTTEGKVISKVTVRKPDTFIEENIADGVNIAGIIGALAAGGGGAKIAFGSVVGEDNLHTITHGLGIKPDIILGGIDGSSTMPTTTFKFLYACGWSNELASLVGSTAKGWYCRHQSSSTLVTTTTSEFGLFTPVDANTFQFGNNSQKLISGIKYLWIAIGGLT